MRKNVKITIMRFSQVRHFQTDQSISSRRFVDNSKTYFLDDVHFVQQIVNPKELSFLIWVEGWWVGRGMLEEDP